MFVGKHSCQFSLLPCEHEIQLQESIGICLHVRVGFLLEPLQLLHRPQVVRQLLQLLLHPALILNLLRA